MRLSCVGTEGLQELGAFSARFWCEPKTPLKNKACLKGKKPTMRHHLTPIGMATIKTKQNRKQVLTRMWRN